MEKSLINLIADGGCYWPTQNIRYSHTIALENGTPFRIAVDGPSSHVYVNGVCRDGMFHILDGEDTGAAHPSANQAVNTTRDPSSNAYLHMQFEIDGRWEAADKMRAAVRFRMDPAEERALDILKPLIMKKAAAEGFTGSEAEILRATARAMSSCPDILIEARRQLAVEAELAKIPIDLSCL